MLRLRGGRFVLTRPVSKDTSKEHIESKEVNPTEESKEDVTVVEKVASSEKEELFKKKHIVDAHLEVQEVDIPCLIVSQSEVQSVSPKIVIVDNLSDEV